MRQRIKLDMNLYWVKTPGNFEDWFIIAPSKEKACSCHELEEGFDEGDAQANLICQVPKDIEVKYRPKYDFKNGYSASLDQLKDLGFDIIEDYPPYVVRGYGRLYYGGKSILAAVLKNLDNKKGVYIVNMRDTTKFKIGITENIQRRLKEFKTSNPATIDLWYFLECKYPRKIENLMHDAIKSKRIGGEWYDLKTFEELSESFKLIEEYNNIKVHDILSCLTRLGPR